MKERLGPGVWIDMADNLHLSIPELLAMVGLEDTPDHRASVTKDIQEMFRTKFPNATIVLNPENK